MEDLILVLAECCGHTWEEMTGKSRMFNVCITRQLIWRQFRRFGMSWNEIGRLFGRRHCSVIHGVRHIDSLLFIGDVYVSGMAEKIDSEIGECS